MRPGLIAGVVVAAAAVGVGARCPGADPRDGDLRTLDGEFPFAPVASAEAWRLRAEEIRLRIKVAAGLWPEPTKGPQNAVVHGRIDMGDYTIEKVYFESMPGHFVTGNLYRPKGGGAGVRRPGVLMPYGHWPGGRFMDAGQGKGGEKKLLESLAGGAERFESGARSPLQARCVHVARMGCVVFHHDMLGTADSIQFPKHRRAAPADADAGEGWLLGGARATGWLQSRMGIQTWNGVRALDFLLGLEDVDPGRVAVMGASGGATQTMMLTAIDGRVRAAFPAVMVSTAMQGGCACENAVYLRIGQGNIDIAALAAPRPLGVTAADDWTVELETKGFPDLQAVYRLLGAEEEFEAHFNTQFKHNFNHVSRGQAYAFLNRHFGLGLEAPVLERDFEFLPAERLTVWGAAHPAPEGERVGDAHERALCRWWAEDARGQMARLFRPGDAAALGEAREVIGGAFSVMLGRPPRAGKGIEMQVYEEGSGPGYSRTRGVLRCGVGGEEVGIILVRRARDGKPAAGDKGAMLWVDGGGADSLLGPTGAPVPEVRQALGSGWDVAGVDVHRPGARWNRRVVEPKAKAEDPWQRDPILTYGYNEPLFVQRVHDVMTVAAWLRDASPVKAKRLRLLGGRGGGHWAAVASAALGDRIERAAIDLGGFRFAAVVSPWAADFLPGAEKYGDVGGALMLAAPRPLWIAGVDGGTREMLRAAYAAAGAPEALTAEDGSDGRGSAGAVSWLMGE